MIKKLLSIIIIGLLLGIIVSLSTIFFIDSVRFLNQHLGIMRSFNASEGFFSDFIWVVVLVPTIGGLIVGLIRKHMDARGPMPLAEVIRSSQSLQFETNPKRGLVTAMLSIISIGSGASLGQYAPVSQLGACISLGLNRFTRWTGFTHTMALGCGVSAAIATAFNAPIAGLIFAHEVILRHYSLRSFAPITVAAVSGYVFSHYIFPRSALFEFSGEIGVLTHEYFMAILLGVVAAYVAMLLVKSIMISEQVAKKIDMPDMFKPALAGLALGITAIWLPDILGVGTSVIRNVMQGELYPIGQLLLTFMFKILFTGICLGFGFVGGVFSPALVIGVLGGAIVGEVSISFFDMESTSAVIYAICGMMAVVSPVIGAPLTAIIIVFELTRNYELTLAAMLSVVFANLVGYRLIGRSLFDLQLAKNNFDLSLGRDRVVLETVPVSNWVSHDYVTTHPQTRLFELHADLIEKKMTEAYVVDEQGRYLGSVTLLQINMLFKSRISRNAKVADYIDRTSCPVLMKDTTLWQAMAGLQDFVGESIPVVSDETSRILLGVVFESSLIAGYMDTLKYIRDEEHRA